MRGLGPSALALALVLMLVPAVASAQPEPPGRCVKDSDCRNGKTCDVSNNQCRCAAATVAADCRFNAGPWVCNASGHCAPSSAAACPAPFSRALNVCRCTTNAACGTGACVHDVCQAK
jgi:hypothetical protein